MTFIAVEELHTNGSALFQDSESFLDELNNGVDASIQGGDSNSIFSSSTRGVLAFSIKGFEFVVITFGIHAITQLVQYFSSDKYKF